MLLTSTEKIKCAMYVGKAPSAVCAMQSYINDRQSLDSRSVSPFEFETGAHVIAIANGAPVSLSQDC